MKTLLIIKNAAVISSIMLIASCSKPAVQPTGSTTMESQYEQSQIKLNLVANAWTDNHDGTFVNSFTDILRLTTLGITSIHTISVHVGSLYGVDLIKYPITYMDGRLEAKVSGNNVILTYRSSTKSLPFTAIPITIIIMKS